VILRDSMSWKKKREIRLRYDAEAHVHDELYSEERKSKYGLALSRIVFSRGIGSLIAVAVKAFSLRRWRAGPIRGLGGFIV
jgi:hypothetical protein